MGRTPTQDEVISGFVDGSIKKAWTLLPGKIEAYDHDTQKADVKPMLKDSLPGDPAEDLPIIRNVPVQWMRIGLAVIYMPMRPGDLVSLLFSSRSLDKWESTNGQDPIDPQDTRHHALSDAIAIPGLYPFGDPIPNVDPADIRIILYDANGNIRSQFYLGGDTGDIVSIPENLIQLGEAEAQEFAAMGESVKAFLESMISAINTNYGLAVTNNALLRAHVHPGVTAGPASTGPSPTLPPIADPSNLSNPTNAVLATKVKLT